MHVLHIVLNYQCLQLRKNRFIMTALPLWFHTSGYHIFSTWFLCLSPLWCLLSPPGYWIGRSPHGHPCRKWSRLTVTNMAVSLLFVLSWYDHILGLLFCIEVYPHYNMIIAWIANDVCIQILHVTIMCPVFLDTCTSIKTTFNLWTIFVHVGYKTGTIVICKVVI